MYLQVRAKFSESVSLTFNSMYSIKSCGSCSSGVRCVILCSPFSVCSSIFFLCFVAACFVAACFVVACFIVA